MTIGLKAALLVALVLLLAGPAHAALTLQATHGTAEALAFTTFDAGVNISGKDWTMFSGCASALGLDDAGGFVHLCNANLLVNGVSPAPIDPFTGLAYPGFGTLFFDHEVPTLDGP